MIIEILKIVWMSEQWVHLILQNKKPIKNELFTLLVVLTVKRILWILKADVPIFDFNN